MYAPEYPIRTERLLLRPLTLDDAAPMLVYKSDADAVRYVPYGQLSLPDIEDRIQNRWSTTRFEKQDDAVCLGIEERETGRLVGDVVLFWRSEIVRARSATSSTPHNPARAMRRKPWPPFSSSGSRGSGCTGSRHASTNGTPHPHGSWIGWGFVRRRAWWRAPGSRRSGRRC